jgi:hypothetical protein
VTGYVNSFHLIGNVFVLHLYSYGGGMPDTKEPEMSRHQFSIAYDGDARAEDHTMDVELLGPALSGIGKLIREANSEINGPKAKANVFVVSDFEHKCFQINFETVLTYYEQLKTFLDSSEVQSAKNIVEWIGLAWTATTLPIATYLGYLKYRNGRKVVDKSEYVDQDGNGMVSVKFEGDHNHIHVHQHTYDLGQNRKALIATRDALSPLGQDGFSKISVNNGGERIDVIKADDTQPILASCNVELDKPDDEQPQDEVTTAWLSVYAPVYDERAEKWRFQLGAEHIYADISETSIAKDALERGGAFADDSYQVRLQISYPEGVKGGKGKPTYRILEVAPIPPSTPACASAGTPRCPPPRRGTACSPP